MALQGTALVRYYIDEAASGSAPASVLDSIASPYDLTIDYGSGNLAYTEVSGNRGLASSASTGTQKARRSIDNTADKVRTGLVGLQKMTIELVVNFTGISASGGRIFGINSRAGDNGRLMLKGVALNDLQFAFNDVSAFVNGSVTSATRHVIHVVVDTTQATAGNRILFYRDGSNVAVTADTMPALNDTLALPADQDLIMFNRESTGSFDRSVTGSIFYAAIYTDALTSGQVSNNATELADDDTPAGGGGGTINAATIIPQLNRRKTGRFF